MSTSQLMSGVNSAAAELVEELINRLQSGGDVEAFIAAHQEHADDLRRLLPAAQVLADLSRSSQADGSFPPAADGPVSGVLGDFRIIREVGRGGMGVVYEAEQISLGRRVALKVLPFASTMDPRQLQRFHNEARAAASLHHEHVVPVYGTGCERGIHYYAMQFVDGTTLAELIHGRTGSHDPGERGRVSAPSDPEAPERSIVLGALTQPRSPETAPVAALSTERSGPKGRAFYRRAAELIAQAADALEHAHSLGVVHRDVKPANLMVDAAGKLWVTDFGLARLGADAGLTMSGDLIGTLRYMAPEQALARHGLVDHRADVYALGATLYELLTGRPAVGGTEKADILRRIAFQEPVPPRRTVPGVPVALETIVLRSMEKNPADRYATALALADELRRFLRNDPIQARRPSLAQCARKTARRHPGVTVTLAAAAVAGLLLGVAGLAVNNHLVRQEQLRTQGALHRAEREKAVAQAVRDFLQNKLLAQADPRAQADASRKGGGQAAGTRPNPTVHELLDRAAGELAPDKIDAQFPGQPQVQAELLRTVGAAYGAIGEYGPAVAHLERARDLHERESGADHPDSLATLESLARTYLDAGRPAEAARLFEQARARRAEVLGPDHPDTLASTNDLVRSYFKLGRHAEALALRGEIVELRRARLGPDHPDTLASLNNLANSYAALKRFPDALRLHAETLALRRAKLGADHPDTLQSLNNLANCHAALGRQAEALKLHQEALALRRAKLGADHPETLQSLNNVAVTCVALGRHADARTLHEETLARRLEKLHADHPDTLQSTNALAWLLANCPDQTQRDPGRAVGLAKQATTLAPGKGEYWITLGTAYYRAGEWENAVDALAKSAQLRKGGDAADWFFRAMAHWHLGDRDEARAWYDRAVQWVEKDQQSDDDLRQFRAEAEDLLGIGGR